MADFLDIPAHQVLATPVSAYMQGRAMQMAYEQDKLQLQLEKAKVDAIPQQQAMAQQDFAMHMLERHKAISDFYNPEPKIIGNEKDGFSVVHMPTRDANGQMIGEPYVKPLTKGEPKLTKLEVGNEVLTYATPEDALADPTHQHPFARAPASHSVNNITMPSSVSATQTLGEQVAKGLLQYPRPGRNGVYSQQAIDVINEAKRINPKVGQDTQPQRQKMELNMTSGPLGNTNRFIANTISHIDQLEGIATARKAGDLVVANRLQKALADELGVPDWTNFETVAQYVGSEATRSVVPGAGAAAERAETASHWSPIKSPEQVAGAAEATRKLMARQIHGLENQYKTAVYDNDFRDRFVPDQNVRSVLEKYYPENNGPDNTPSNDGWTIKVK
jgi:hypothetical protein